MNQLEVLRESLGQCDEIILDALLMRNRIVEDIMVYKEANDLPVLQPEQEAKQKGWLEARMEGRRHKKEVNDVFASIIQNSKRIQSRNLFNYNIFLIGFMGAGKSTISDYLKNVLAMDVVEMDQCIVERQGMSISDIFETYGEEYFRELETNLLIEKVLAAYMNLAPCLSSFFSIFSFMTSRKFFVTRSSIVSLGVTPLFLRLAII